jgi:hypothetical protein
MEVDEMIEVVSDTIDLLNYKLDIEADQHYANVIYQPVTGMTMTEPYASKYANEDLELIERLHGMLQSLDVVIS